MSRETHDKLREAQDLMRHRVPNGDVAEIFEQALTLLLDDLRKARFASTVRPRTTSKSTGRHIQAAVKRAVWARDHGRCAFVGSQGQCTERGFLDTTISCHSRTADWRRWTTSSCAAGHTMPTRRSDGLGCRRRISSKSFPPRHGRAPMRF